MTQKPETPFTPSEKPTLHSRHRHRSESSPSVPLLRFLERRDPGSSPTFRSYRGIGDDFASPNGRVTAAQRDRQYTPDYDSRVDTYRTPQDYTADHRSRSPSRLPAQTHNENVSASMNDRYLTNSPTKTLDDVFERDEAGEQYLDAPSSPPKKRSRSPMKKMFGEHGWLGRSPDELEDVKLRVRKASSRKEESTGSPQKKTSMMGKLKNKFEEFVSTAQPTNGAFFNAITG
jgi:hypothetical protein